MTTTTKRIKVECSKCQGRGKIFGFSSIDNGRCFQCGGSGAFMMTAAAHAKLLATRERAVAMMEAERAEESREADLYHLAVDAIQCDGVDGARAFFRAHRADMTALAALVGAMRDEGLTEESNAIVRWRRAQELAA